MEDGKDAVQAINFISHSMFNEPTGLIVLVHNWIRLVEYQNFQLGLLYNIWSEGRIEIKKKCPSKTHSSLNSIDY